MAYGARLESVLGESPRGFESPILRHVISRDIVPDETLRALLCKATPTIFLVGTNQRPA